MITRLSQSSFLRAIAMLTGGQAVATLVPILAAPILGRLYMPTDYGALAAYMAPAAILAVLATLQFQHAIITEGTSRNAAQVGWLCLISALAGGGATALAVATLWNTVLLPTAAGAWFALLPVTVAGAGVIAAGQFQANRHRHYRWIAVMRVINVLATVALSIMLGLLGWGSNGLLSAYFLGQIVQILGYGLLLTRGATALPRPSPRRLRTLIRRHWKFPTFTLPSEFSGQVNMQMPVLAMTAIGADATLGAFTRARQLVSMPVNVLGQSVSQVFRREAAELYRQTGSCRGLMLKTSTGMLAAGIFPCVLLMVFAPWLFTVYLGPAWHEAGELARILAPMLLLNAIVSPITTIFYIAEKQDEDLILTILTTSTTGLTIYISYMIFDHDHSIVYAFATCYSAIYVLYFFRSLSLGKQRKSS